MLKKSDPCRSVGVGLLLMLAAGSSPLFAWKTQLLATNSVHGRITIGALGVVRYRNTYLGFGDNKEWDRFQGVLTESTGWLNKDSNAHGNMLWNNQR